MNFEKHYIRQANPSDYKLVAPLILQAMDDLGGILVNSENNQDALALFEYLFKIPSNQYSYEFTLLYKNDNEIKGSVTGYDGAFLEKYRQVVLDYVKEAYKVTDLNFENESNADEFYIDTLSVNPEFHGQGIGTKLLKAICTKAKTENHEKIGLLVSKENPKAKQLYLRLGFKTVGTKNLGGHIYEHLQKDLNI